MKYFKGNDKELDLKEVNSVIEKAFADHGNGLVQMPPKMYISLPQGDFRTMPAYLPSLGIAGVKIVNVHPDNPARGLPTVMALTVLLDIPTGKPEAIINATHLTDMRTGAAGAIACKYLSGKKEVILGLIGTGRQAQAQVAAIGQEITISEIRVWSRNPLHTERFSRGIKGIECHSSTIERACDCDVLVTTTPSKDPIVMSGMVHEGTHINAIGADAPGKEELDPVLLSRASVFADDVVQAVHSGEINVPIKKGLFYKENIAGTLGEVVIGRKKRKCPEEITIFDSTGLAIQDLAIAKIAMLHGTAIVLPFP
jgi:alanine dehydrogenase